MNGVIFVIHQLICGTKELINLYVKHVAKNIKYQNYKNHIRTIRNQRVRRQFYFISYNVKVLCAVGDFGYGTFNLPQTLIRSINLNKPPQPLLHKTRVISWLRLIKRELNLKREQKEFEKRSDGNK